MELSKKDFQKLLQAAILAGRLNELDRIKGFVPSVEVSKRRSILKNQLRELTGEKKEKEEEATININIEIPGGEVKKDKKSLKFSLKDLLSPKKEDEDYDDDVVKVIRGLWPEEDFKLVGKIITEL